MFCRLLLLPTGEAAAIAMGLVMVGSFNETAIDDMVNVSLPGSGSSTEGIQFILGNPFGLQCMLLYNLPLDRWVGMSVL